MQKAGIPSNKKGGIAVVLLIFVLLIAIGGAGYYYFGELKKETYAADTIRMAAETSQAALQLSERSTPKDIERVRAQIENYLARHDAEQSARASWIAQVDAVEHKLAERDTKIEAMRKRIAEFNPNSSLAQLETFETELKAFTQNLDMESRNRLLVAWSQTKNQITVDIQSVSATIIAKTFPSGAKTYLDGEYIGLSSLGIQKVRRGKHILTFEKEGYLTAQIEVDVSSSEKIEPPAVELKTATHPLQVTVTGGKKRAKISISIEKTADGNEDIILYIDEQEGREANFAEAPIGRLRVSVTADLRLAAELFIENGPTLTSPLEINLD